jgi:hypothetical protein
MVEWKQPKKPRYFSVRTPTHTHTHTHTHKHTHTHTHTHTSRYRDLGAVHYEHLLDLWALRLDGGEQGYYTQLMKRYRARSNRALTPAAWVDTERVGNKGKQFMKTPQKIMVRVLFFFFVFKYPWYIRCTILQQMYLYTQCTISTMSTKYVLIHLMYI